MNKSFAYKGLELGAHQYYMQTIGWLYVYVCNTNNHNPKIVYMCTYYLTMLTITSLLSPRQQLFPKAEP